MSVTIIETENALMTKLWFETTNAVVVFMTKQGLWRVC